ncbi:MAG: cobalamin-dependent protein [Oscillospiraceae bacterium]|nr:cobalamin-dependent protein [Oscillospiraceae bacterium]
MNEKYLNLKEAICDGDDEAALDEVENLLEASANPLDIFTDCVEPTLNELGEQFAKLEIFLPDLVLAGEAVAAIQSKLLPIMQEQNIKGRQKGRGVIATVSGDIHDIGKNMVCLMMQINGFEMVDLGVDVAPMEILRRAEEMDADIVALSGLMLPSLPFMKETIELVRHSSKLGGHTKIMVGGGPVTKEWADANGADGYSDDSIGAVKLAHELMGLSA